MLKQYKKLLYILGVVLLNLIPPAANAVDYPAKRTEICRELVTPIDLNKALGIQISPSNGYWTDGQGNIVNNIFNPIGLSKGQYSFTFHVTTDNYCGVNVGDTFAVTVDIRENLLKVKYTASNPRCDNSNGVITIDSIKNGTGYYDYMLTYKGATKIDTINKWKTLDSIKALPVTVNDGLKPGKYFLYVLDTRNSISCSPLYVDTIVLENVAVTIGGQFTTEIIAPGVINDGTVGVDPSKIQGGTIPYTYEWFKYNSQTGIYDAVANGAIYADIQLGEQYKVVVTDKYGCTGENFYTSTQPPGLQFNYFFCQGNFVEMYSGKMITPQTIEQLLFSTSGSPAGWAGYTVKVYDDSTATTPISKDAWWVNAVNSGVHNNDSTLVKYIELSSSTVTLPRFKVTVKVFGRPANLSLSVTNSKYEWDIEDMVRLQTLPENVSGEERYQWYVYYLNNRRLDSIELNNLFAVSASDFTGTVEDWMKVKVYELVHTYNNITLTGKDSTCVWTIDEPMTINVPFPNTFTPDGDGVNDVFLGGDKFGGRDFHLEIINRYGHRLYYGDKGWDGTYKGTQVAPGVYYYIVQIKMSNGTTKTVKGAVTLIRKAR